MERRLSQLVGVSDTIEIKATDWGLTLREVHRDVENKSLRAAVFNVLTVISLSLVVGQWVSAPVPFDSDVLAFKLALSGAGLALVLVFWRAARPQPCPEVQFDLNRQEIRFAATSERGIPLAHVAAVTVTPIIEGSEYARMRLFFDGVAEGVLLCTGRRGALERAASRLRREILKTSR